MKIVKVFDNIQEKYRTLDKTKYIKHPELIKLSKALNVKLKGLWDSKPDQIKLSIDFYYKHGVLYERINMLDKWNIDVQSYISWNPDSKLYEICEVIGRFDSYNTIEEIIDYYCKLYEESGFIYIGKK